jgi:hypothetical protein
MSSGFGFRSSELFSGQQAASGTLYELYAAFCMTPTSSLKRVIETTFRITEEERQKTSYMIFSTTISQKMKNTSTHSESL